MLVFVQHCFTAFMSGGLKHILEMVETEEAIRMSSEMLQPNRKKFSCRYRYSKC